VSARDELVAAGAQLAALGLSSGSSGNLSIREGDTIVMSPTGSNLAALDPARLSVLDFDGNLLDGPAASKEFPFHRAMYRRDASCRAIVHLHSRAAAAVSCLPAWSPASAVPPLTPYFVMRVGQTPLIPYAAPGNGSQAELIESLDLAFRSVLLQNHGSITSGVSMSAAVDAAIELEEVCALLLLIGDRPARLLSDAEAIELAERYDSPWSVAARA
jgi:ribulose-5-phosphate 4-epimerase/fuculose-1-phosphate aldolase